MFFMGMFTSLVLEIWLFCWFGYFRVDMSSWTFLPYICSCVAVMSWTFLGWFELACWWDRRR